MQTSQASSSGRDTSADPEIKGVIDYFIDNKTWQRKSNIQSDITRADDSRQCHGHSQALRRRSDETRGKPEGMAPCAKHQ